MGTISKQPAMMAYPILGFPVKGVQKIILLAPNHSEISEIHCDLVLANNIVATVRSEFRDSVIRCYEFEFKNLVAGCQYRYQFRTDTQVLDIGEDLKASDLNFFFYDRFTKTDIALLVSCNGVKDFHEKSITPFGMWERMLEEVEKLPQRPRLIINGGDQYYQDTIEKTWIKQLSDENFPKVREEFKRASLQNALEHMSNPAYRKLMAQIPSIAMLDDHDITDGAGGRPEYFVGKDFSPEYKNFLSIQLELFELIQASRNPEPILKTELTGFSFVLDLGDCAIVALDLRTQKNSKKSQLMEPNTEKAVLETIEQLPHKNVMILIPVVPFRNARKLEGWLLSCARVAAIIAAKIVPRKAIGAKTKAGLEFVASLEDDLLDALSSESNIGFLTRLLKILSKGARKGVSYSVLSGDIHTGGVVESHVKVEGFTFKLPIIVSSPIGYQPMHFAVETLLKERKLINFSENGVEIRGLNNAFTTQRNFISFSPAVLGSADRNSACALFQEEVPGAKLLPIDSWIETTSTAEPISVVENRLPEIQM